MMRLDACGCRQTRSRGFTLIEMLVVLLIMGLLLGLVSANMHPDERGQLRIEADRLAQLLELAGTESRLSGKTLAWTADDSGYRFWRFDEQAGWFEVSDSDLLRARTLPTGMTISGLRVESMKSAGDQGQARLEFSANGMSLAFTIELSLGAAHYRVRGSPIGEVQALGADGTDYGKVY